MTLPAAPSGAAPDGTDVRPLLALAGGSVAHFELPPGRVSRAVAHRTVEEVWYVLGGAGRLWRSQDGRAEVVEIGPGACLTIPLGTSFQFRSEGPGPLAFVAATMPPWPAGEEAFAVEGPWPASV